MVTKKLFTMIDQLQAIQRLATQCPDDVAFHNEDSTVVIDAKSYIGMYALNYQEPVLLVSENKEFHRKIETIGETVK